MRAQTATGCVSKAAVLAVLLATSGCGWLEIGADGGEAANGPQVAMPQPQSQSLPAPLPPPMPRPASGSTPRSGGESVALSAARANPGTAAREGAGSYRVKPGDTVYSVAEAHEVDAYALANANGLVPPFDLREGQRLTIPGHSDSKAIVAAPSPRPGTESSAAPRAREERSASLPPVRDPLPELRDDAAGFIWPVEGRVLSGFGAKGDGRFNDGINIAASEGTPVRASESGVVAYAGNELRAFGSMLLIRHANGWISTYAHNQELLVRRGEQVRRGQVIARVGSTGGVSQPQLHFELRRGKRAVDPQQVLRRANAERSHGEPAG